MTRPSRLLLAMFACTACRASHTPALESLPAPNVLVGERFQNDAGASAALTDALETPWWQRYGDPLLEELVVDALEHNYSLIELAATVVESEERLRASGAARGPSIDGEFLASRNMNVIETRNFGIGGERRRIYDPIIQPSLSISWQADLFGRLASAERGQYAALLATENDRLALAHSVIASLARQRAALSAGSRQLDVARRVAESRQRTLAIVEGRYARGVSGTSAVDVRLARENLASAQAQIAPLELSVARATHAIAELVGRTPAQFRFQAGELPPPLPALAPPPAGLPIELLERRPDLRAAQFRAEAAAADVDVAIANRYPDLVLSATGGWNGNELAELFDAETLFGNIVANLSATLFSSGRLEAEVAAARARLEASAARYAASVLAAAREVEDALATETYLREQLSFVEVQRDEARRAETLARDRYQDGLENLLTVFETERRRAAAESTALQLERDIWNARTDLHLALGGDWSIPAARPAAVSETH